jgi:hypothetical protein
MADKQPWEVLEAAASALREMAALDSPSLPEGLAPLVIASELVELAGRFRKNVRPIA